MTRLNPNNKAPEWASTDWATRAANCVLFLSAHRFISEAEARLAYERIDKWAADAVIARLDSEAAVPDERGM